MAVGSEYHRLLEVPGQRGQVTSAARLRPAQERARTESGGGNSEARRPPRSARSDLAASGGFRIVLVANPSTQAERDIRGLKA